MLWKNGNGKTKNNKKKKNNGMTAKLMENGMIKKINTGSCTGENVKRCGFALVDLHFVAYSWPDQAPSISSFVDLLVCCVFFNSAKNVLLAPYCVVLCCLVVPPLTFCFRLFKGKMDSD